METPTSGKVLRGLASASPIPVYQVGLAPLCNRARNLVPRSRVIEQALTNCNCVFAYSNPGEVRAESVKDDRIMLQPRFERDISKETFVRGRDIWGKILRDDRSNRMKRCEKMERWRRAKDDRRWRPISRTTTHTHTYTVHRTLRYLRRID